MLDLSKKTADYPQLLENDYTSTHEIGARVHKEGGPFSQTQRTHKCDAIQPGYFK
jgi:hypothetical protein